MTDETKRRHAEAMRRFWHGPRPEKPSGTNPRQCRPFLDPEKAQRVDCSRRRECLNHAFACGWNAWTCSGCEVNQPIVLHAEPRRLQSPHLAR